MSTILYSVFTLDINIIALEKRYKKSARKDAYNLITMSSATTKSNFQKSTPAGNGGGCSGHVIWQPRKGVPVFDVEKLSPVAGPTSSSNPSKISSSMTMPAGSKLVSSSVSSLSISSNFSVVGETGEEGVGLFLLSSSLEVVGLLREVPAKEFRWVGTGWLCSPVYVMINIPGSDLFRSTCFRAKQPFEVLHL